MDLGMPVLIEFDSLEENIGLCRELDLSFIELNMNIPIFQIGRLDSGILKRHMEREGIYFTLHTVDDINIADFNHEVAEVHVKTVTEALRLANETGIPLINMHMNNGTLMTLPDKRVYLYDKYFDLYIERIKEFRDKCESRAGDVTICIENCNGFTDFTARAVEYLLESDVFGLTLDIGHDYAAGGADMDFYRKNIHKLRHMHIHDGRQGRVHQTLGTGEIDLQKMIGLAEERKCRAVLEVKTSDSLRESVRYYESLYINEQGRA